MRILAFADTRFPIERANGLQTMATCQALARRGHQVRLVVRPDTAVPARDPFAFYDLARVDGLTIEHVPAPRAPRARRARFLVAAAHAAATRQAEVVFTRDLGLAAFLLQWPRWRRPRLVYESHGISPIVSGEMPRLLGAPALAPSPAKLARLDRREARVWRRAAAYVTITRALADDLTARYGPRAALFVVPDGARAAATREIDPGGRFSSRISVLDGSDENRPPGSISRAGCVVGYAGHLYPWKGVDVLVDALALAPGVSGLIVGGHREESDLERVDRKICNLGLSDRVVVTGHVPPAEVAARLAPATILVLPNTRSVITERYTSPLKLFEYLALGKPIVASDVAAIREIVADGQTALLVPPDNPRAFAAAFERLWSDPALAARLGAAAAALAADYTWDRRAERLEAALDAAGHA